MKTRRPCAGLWNTPMVHLNGDLTTCCLDTGLKNRLGNLRETSLEALWNGPTIHAWRLAQIRGDYASSGPYCTACDWWSAGTYPDDLIEAYLEQTGETALLDRIRKSRETDPNDQAPVAHCRPPPAPLRDDVTGGDRHAESDTIKP